MTGKLIALEGIDGSGKSTQACRLAGSLGAELTFQFGATEIGSVIRDLLLSPTYSELDDKTEALLVVADKAQHLTEIVHPALQAGRDVVTDRYTASTLVYQGYGRGIDLVFLKSILQFATSGLEPDLTILLDLDPAQASNRLQQKLDRIEDATTKTSFVSRIRNGYIQLAAESPDSWVVVDASGNIDEVAIQIEAVARKFFCERTL
ncbi:MAG: dTMP kinase [Acidimicrobiaceae bacterium]|nr:dTMP kinase [Acidimicrobiaceae bacterium]